MEIYDEDTVGVFNMYIGGEEVVDVDPKEFDDFKRELAEAKEAKAKLEARVARREMDVMEREA